MTNTHSFIYILILFSVSLYFSMSLINIIFLAPDAVYLCARFNNPNLILWSELISHDYELQRGQVKWSLPDTHFHSLIEACMYIFSHHFHICYWTTRGSQVPEINESKVNINFPLSIIFQLYYKRWISDWIMNNFCNICKCWYILVYL